MPTFADLDYEYRRILHLTGGYLPTAFENALSADNANLGGIEYTRAILWRLKTYYSAQKQIKEFIGKRYSAPASDFLVETVAFYLKVAVKLSGLDVEVASEKTIVSRRGALRPDITVWRKQEVLAAIECKTQLGWNRDDWQSDFLIRERKLSEYFPKARLFLLVMTGSNWGGLNASHSNHSEFFVLLKNLWPIDVDLESQYISGVNHRIEQLFQEIFSGL
ncbi:MAG: hypothetical protein K8F90_18905 [Hyphomicrobiales bacterium]|nr:hypothetical protein [Hyphomicrobiales bacterium]